MSERWELILDEQLAALPPGIAWPRTRDSLLAALLEPMARGLADLYDAADAMLLEIDPRSATWLLPDYEEALGPDPCRAGGYAETLEERRLDAHARWVAGGGQSVPFFLAHARVFDPTATIEEFASFECGASECGISWSKPEDWYAPEGLPIVASTGAVEVDDQGRTVTTGPLLRLPPRWQLGPPEMRFYWRVSFSRPEFEWFRLGQGGGECGVEPLCAFERQEEAECRLARRKPAHTQVLFDYTAPAWRSPEPLTGAA